ncbi:MAG: winged helix-turn-helix domain-containing protein [Chlorobaculum sp.]|nr:winged helix-turn-helix domain-containing protein [Chlorobaculum sp.]
MPDKKHPKSDPEAQEEWKKTSGTDFVQSTKRGLEPAIKARSGSCFRTKPGFAVSPIRGDAGVHAPLVR